MGYHRRARRDDNHAAIAAAYERLGCKFIDLSQTPCGFDGAVGYGGLTSMVEIKNPNADNWTKRSKKRRRVEQLLTENEKRAHDTWTGGKRLIMTVEDVAAHVNALRKWHRFLVAHLLAESQQPAPAVAPSATPRI